MIKRIIISIFILFVGLQVDAACEIRTDYARERSYNKKYAILIYMNGSDLESKKKQATQAINEMLKVSGNKKFPAAFIIETGGTKIWHTPEAGKASNTRFVVKDGEIQNISYISNRSIGEMETFADFLNYGLGTYPAKHYILIFWNHGEGSLKGFGRDELNNFDTLTLEEMEQAFKLSKASRLKFALLGFDACLMSTIEVANTLAKHGYYLLASQEVVKQNGWDYTTFSVLSGKNTTIKKLARTIMDNYIIGESNYSISFWDLNEVANLTSVLETALNRWQDRLPILSEKVLRERKFIPDFGGNISQKTMNYIYPDMVDLDALIAIIAKNDIINSYKRAKSKTILYHLNSGYETKPGGINIFLPYGGDFTKEKLDLYKTTGFSKQYLEFIDKYYNTLSEKNIFYIDNAPKPDATGRYYLSADTANIAAVYDTLLLPKQHGCYSSLGYIISDAEINEDKIYIEKPKLWLMAFNQPLYTIEKSKNTYLAPFLLQRDGVKQMVNAEISYKPSKKTFTIKGITEMNKDVSRDLGAFEAGDLITPVYPVFKLPSKNNKFIEQTKEVSFEYGVQKQIMFRNIIGLSFKEIPNSYQLRFLIEDKQGNKYYSLPVIK